MALVVEDGSGVTNAESYITLADADTRHSDFGNTAWTGADADKEAALRRATAYIEQAYRSRWQGFRRHVDQALSWPRWNVVVDEFWIGVDIVPPEVANACADLALKALAGDLNADLTRGVITEKVGPIETQFDRYSPQAVRYPAIDQMLSPFLVTGGASVKMIRA